ncbi:CotS family spore coat protein [Paenibacillus roseipurpureus]|uniref:CotS family spore coat protein n=1 Tax=Paenibacillus roseopurpureus TaxID=2918901 RepID=A0AA96LQM9_9BACL|nr:CotS family spore coat protein [Paenibacillus sp. MBLB1832]WNR46230.1 CotS family spore coat protein [Paenibacillus sp. MBLB1832]
MENYQIVPWLDVLLDPGIVAEQYVPPELEQLAREVMTHYDMEVHDMLLVTSKPDKGGAIWKIATNKGNLSIKCLHRRPRRSLFSVGAQKYMSELGHRVPSFIPTKEGNYFVEAGGKLWIVTDWIEPLIPVSKIDLEGASQLCYGLGEFHKNSKGYVPPVGSEKSSRIHGWGKYYEKIIAKIGWFQDIALAYPETGGSGNLLAVVEDFKRQANEIYQRFQNSAYTKMVAKGGPHWGLAHQDFGWSNGQMGPGGIWVIDLDGVSYDLPIRDLRKLITSTMDDMGVWDLTWIRGMIDAYHQANPLDQETFEILWIDMAFPNEFYKHVKEIVFNPVPFLDLELTPILQRVLATETSKWQALSELEQDKAKYPAGDYTAEVIAPFVYERPASTLPGDLIAPPAPVFTEIPVPEPVVVPAIPAPRVRRPRVIIRKPARRRKRVNLRVPKKRVVSGARNTKKVLPVKKKQQQKIIYWRFKPRYKLVWSTKNKRYVKILLPAHKPLQKLVKPAKRITPPLKKKINTPTKKSTFNSQKLQPMKKKQLKLKPRTA